ncbi:MAG: universal stress protein [Cyclobacteriaceae bacterium]
MITFDKVLVCVNLSSAGHNIIEKACTIAKKAQTKEVAFLYVVKDFNFPEELQQEFPDLLDKAIEERKNELQRLIEASFNCQDIATKLLIRQGNLTREILSASVEEAADLIVIERNQDSDSVLNTRIARRAACNLLIIPRTDELEFDRIHVPVDFSNYTDLSLETALTLSEGQPSEIYLHNVYSVPSSYRYSGKTFEEFAQILEEHAAKDLLKLTKTASVDKQKLKTIHTIDRGNGLIDIIYKEAKSRDANLIVMGAKGRTAASALFIGSKAERMIQVNSDIPLLVIRKKGSNAGIIESLQDL